MTRLTTPAIVNWSVLRLPDGLNFSSFSPATCLHKVNFRVADDTSTIIPRMRLNPMLRYKYDIRQAAERSRQCEGRAMRNPTW